MAGFVEIFEVQGIVHDLISGMEWKRRFADLEFQDEDHGTDEEHDVNPSAHAGDVVFEVDFPLAAGQDRFEDIDLDQPSLTLGLFEGKGVLSGQFAENGLR